MFCTLASIGCKTVLHSFTGEQDATKRREELEAVDEDREEDGLRVGLQVIHRAVAHHIVEVEEGQDEVFAANQLASIFVDQILNSQVSDLAEDDEHLALHQRLGDSDKVSQHSDDVRLRHQRLP